jgi:DNA-binding NtrC family response regulator
MHVSLSKSPIGVVDFVELNLIGESRCFQEALHTVCRCAACDATVLLQSETGTGKELVARAIHYLGARRGAAFVPMNCGAIPESLVENELFGHARGAFTDARESRLGAVGQAEGGTLFLDEVDAFSVRAQIALLRFLQDCEYRPIGDASVRHANVRIIASTNADLNALVAAGLFRTDLLYRLNVLALELPPLRLRERDVIVLAETFVRRFSHKYGKPVATLHPETIAYFLRYDWPGNVRELENLIHREVLMSKGPCIHVQGPEAGRVAPAPALTAQGFSTAKALAVAEFERAYLRELLSRTGGNISEAARLAGKERSRLSKLAKKHGLLRSQVPDRVGRP